MADHLERISRIGAEKKSFSGDGDGRVVFLLIGRC